MRGSRSVLVVLTPVVIAALVGAAACGSSDESSPPSVSPDATDGPVTPVGDAPIPSPFGLDTRPTNPTCLAPARPPPATSAGVAWQPVFTTLGLGPLQLINLVPKPGDPTRWFATSRLGSIYSLSTTGAGSITPIADLSVLGGATVIDAGEGGFLGFALHPKFTTNGRAYVSWTHRSGQAELGYLTSVDGGASFSTYTQLLAFDRADQHCGGGLAFGPDGHLYASFGDAGTSARGQDRTGYYGKVIRIDVDTPPPAGKAFVIPPDNPFANGGGEPATFAFGLRNPFRFSFDRGTGQLWLGDVGEAVWEEVDVVKNGGNYGWACREAAHVLNTPADNPAYCPSDVGLIDPVAEIEHVPLTQRRAITGGVVYRGKTIPSMVGTYVFGDSSAGEIFGLTFDVTTGAPATRVLNDASVAGGWVHFAEDLEGEIFAVGFDGPIYKMVPPAVAPAPAPFPERLSQTGCVDPADATRPVPAAIPYGVNVPFWSDGAEKDRWLAVPDGTTITPGPDGDLDLPVGSVVGKTFRSGGVRIETRLMVRHADGEWAGYTYAWNDAQTDATLLPSSATRTVGDRPFYLPARHECVQCHTAAAGRTLGLELAQLDGDLVYPTTARRSNQLATLNHIGLFGAAGTRPADASAPVPAFPDPFGTAPLELRARAYLHTNCASCHRPGTTQRTDMDLRFGTPLASTKACGAAPKISDLGVADAKLLLPGSPSKSLLALRMRAAAAHRMPPLGLLRADDAGIALVEAWIASLVACP